VVSAVCIWELPTKDAIGDKEVLRVIGQLRKH
jgi:hypothetical protein